MAKKIYSLLVVLIAAVLLVACGSNNSKESDASSKADAKWEKIKESGTLKVATAGTLFPQSYHTEDNELTGYDVEIIKEIAKRLDLKVEFVEMNIDGMLASLDNGQIDVAGYSIEKDSKNAEKFLYTTSHKYSFTSMIVRESDNSGINSLEDLKGKKAAGAASTPYMKIAKKYGAELVIYDNVTNDVYARDVANGRTDVIINDYYLQKMALTAFADFPIKILEDVYFNPSEANFALKLDNTTLQAKMNEALEDMRQDGTLTKLSEQFFAGEDVSKEKDYDLEKIDISDIE
ncbi:transporter substrate-binding domain-containing protein [Streptococcus pacificus]|uniref:Transporter substrate-binding domain-containing protein n=1 Tax=Streptococcus pacificus TaxID=2740577 RepID=A0ABS0ZIN1_9STRE|nr:transporter substrate-binding domain-containing protein [Streptococcus pacificus]MBJ8325829.1 transporter substrate-binding domain-containing protein [Streptococcus pacificus]